MTARPPPCRPWRSLPRAARATLGAWCLGALLLVIHLAPRWRTDDNLSHGPFVPGLVALLLLESRRDRQPRFLAPGPGLLLGAAGLTGAALVSLLAATVYAAAVGWSHALVDFLLAAAAVLAGAAAWLGLADRRSQVVPFNWAAGMAVILWLFAAPPPPGTYARVALALQGVVTRGVVATLHGLGIAAFQAGNTIELARTSVGVSEACSGVRSLVSCGVAGLFLSGVLVRRPGPRAVVVLAAPLIGLGMNFVRSLVLTLLANGGVAIAGRWHDLTGSAIIAVTTALVAALAWGLHRREGPAEPPEDPPAAAGASPLWRVLAAGLALAAAGAGGLAAQTRSNSRPNAPVPDLAALLPPAPPGWTATTATDLGQFSGDLATHLLVERVYAADPEFRGAHFTLYLAYWRPGQAPVSLVDAHTPDICWPGTGWVAKPVAAPRAGLTVDGRPLPPAECRLFARGAYETRVWYWHLYGGRPLAIVDPHSVTRLLRTTLRFGFGQPEDQLFVRISSNRPWEEIASSPALRQFFSGLQPLGL